MNYKQTKNFNERKIMFLMMMAHYPVDLDELGTLIPIKQIEKKLGIKGAAHYRCLNSLENEGMIFCNHRGYEAGTKSRRWLITEKADEIIKNEETILKFIEKITDYHKSLGKQNTNVIPIKNEGGKIGYSNIDIYNKIINKINNLVILNNKYCIIKSESNLRIDYKKTKKSNKSKILKRPRKNKVKEKVIQGRVFNALCLTKSGKKKAYMKSDKRFYRNEYLKIIGLPDYKEIYDIKNQIPRLTYILQGGNYDDINDFYAIEGLDRGLVKKYAMSAYFDISKKAGANHRSRAFLHLKINKENRRNKIFVEVAREIIYKNFGIIWDHYRNLITPIGSEIFLWTALWEQLIIKEAREKLGVHLLNVYDGFYYNDEAIKNDLIKIVKETSIEVKQLYDEIKQTSKIPDKELNQKAA